eukprot:58465_1
MSNKQRISTISSMNKAMKKWFDKKSLAINACDAKEASKCGSIHRIGIILSYYNKWLKLKQKDKLKYGMYEFIHSGIQLYPFRVKTKSESKDDTPRFTYSSLKLLEDYHHILYDHDGEDDLESISDYLLHEYLSNTICKPRQCQKLKRNNRDRWSLSMNNAKRIKV